MSIPSLPTTFTPIPGAGARLYVQEIGTTAVHIIAHLSDVTPPDIQVGKMDTTSHDSNRIKTQLPGEITMGDTTATAYFNKVVANWLSAAIQARTVYFWTIELSDGTLCEITGYLSNFGVMAPLDGNQAMTTKISITSTDSNLGFAPA